MSFVRLARPYSRFFYLFGQIPHSLDYFFRKKREKRSKWFQILLKIPSILLFAFNLALCGASVSAFNVDDGLIRSYSILVHVYVFCELIKIFVILHRNFACDKLMCNILGNFQSIDSLFRSVFHCPILFTSFKHAYMKKICLAFGSYGIHMTFVALYYLPYGRISITNAILGVMQFISITEYMHVLFFIDSLTFYSKHLNTTIARDNGDCGADDEFVVWKRMHATDMTRKMLFKYKVIHFRLKKTADQLNEFFGWTLLFLTLESFIQLVNYTDWLLRVLIDLGGIMKLIRKTTNVKITHKEFKGCILEIVFPVPILTFTVLAVCGTLLFNSCHNCQVEVTFILVYC